MTIMRIDDQYVPSATAAKLSRAQPSEKADQQPASNQVQPRETDKVQLSGLAETVQALESDSSARLARLEELSKIVAIGKYSPDTDVVADRLIDDSLGSGATDLTE